MQTHTNNPIQLSVVIVSYNVRHFLKQALLSVRKASEGINVEVFVVDNNSHDDSVQMVREQFPEVRLLANPGNPGFSIANNQAIRLARGEQILLLNPDTVVAEDTFSTCLQFMHSHPNAGALGVRMIDGSGVFLPESKRSFPTPFVAFCKMSGLSRLFPESRLFSRYALGYLAERQNHKVEVLAGAFMWIRRDVLQDIGLLDESFFMYGEDIDLSYRIVQAGYENWYLADTTILHYKGESTVKSSLKFTRAFYHAMIIFADKHFQGKRALLYRFLLHSAIYTKAAGSVISSRLRGNALLLLDILLITLGLWLLSTGSQHQPLAAETQRYTDQGLGFFIGYLPIWLLAIQFGSGYDKHWRALPMILSLLLSTPILYLVYQLTPDAYKTSQNFILPGTLWALATTLASRISLRIARYRKLGSIEKNVLLAGTHIESSRVSNLFTQMRLPLNILGTITVGDISDKDRHHYLGNLANLHDLIRVHNVDELIFCARDIDYKTMLKVLSDNGPSISYKIIASGSSQAIGSTDKNSSGEVYSQQRNFELEKPAARRSKRVTDIALSLFSLLALPVMLVLVENPHGFLRNTLTVLSGRKTWVQYTGRHADTGNLPRLKQGVLTPLARYGGRQISSPATLSRINTHYARHYSPFLDIFLYFKAFRQLGKQQD